MPNRSQPVLPMSGDPSLSLGLILGQELGRVTRIEERVDALEAAGNAMRAELDGWLYWVRRLAIIAALWGAALGGNLAREPAADIVAQIIQRALKL